jgi:N-acetylmuramoyl-L-alanine amidase
VHSDSPNSNFNTAAYTTYYPVSSSPPPSVDIDVPATGSALSGTVTVSGWALDNFLQVGTAISSVKVLVDGNVVGNATYGLNRPDVCAAYPGRPGCPNVGYTYSLNTAALIPGQHTITVSATDEDSPTPDVGFASTVVTVTIGPPSVIIDSPAVGTVVSGNVTVSGWAIDNTTAIGTAIGSVQVKVDGTVVGNAAYGNVRSDVCAVYPGRLGCPNVGYTFTWNATSALPGPHTLTVCATDTDSSADSGCSSVAVTVALGPPSVYIENPTVGTAVTGTVAVSGWAIDNTTAIGTAIHNVQVKVDGNVMGNAAYGASRQDVCAAYPGRPGCPNVGYTYSLNTGSLMPGTHLLTVCATDSDASSDVGCSSGVSIIVGQPPSVYIEAPGGGTVSGVVTVSGWAIDNVNVIDTAISSVQVKVDGTVVGNAIYGIPRPDVCAAYPGRPGCPNVGFSYALSTGALSGSHTISVCATNTDPTPLTTCSSVQVTVVLGPPSVFIETPAPGATVSGLTTLSGWALDNTTGVGTAIGVVQVKVDGTVVGNATYGIPRSDVCAAYPGRPGCPNVGLMYSLNTGPYSGSHTVSVCAIDSDGAPETGCASITVTIQQGPPSVYLDTPIQGQSISGVVTIEGWALDNTTSIGTPISSVQVKVDGNVVGNATYGENRSDVCAAYPGRPGCPNVGFTYALNTAAISPGTHTIVACATNTDGNPQTGCSDSATVTITSGSPSVYVETPAPGATVSGTIAVSGWAIDNTTTIGTAISSVQVKIDNTITATAIYGVNRPDVCAAYPGRPGCPNVGFTYSLNTATLSSGAHTITVCATDSDPVPDVACSAVPIMK